MEEKLRQLVWQRAAARCEYCQVPQKFDELPFHVDHIISQKQHGPTEESNLALACLACNTYKGALTSIVLPETGEVVRLFHPRQDLWADHFEWQGPRLIGRTAIGRATVDMLGINLAERVAFREELQRGGHRSQ